MSLAILFHFLCAQQISDINVSIIRSLRLFCWITTLVVLFLVPCVLEFRCGWVGVVSVLQAVELPRWSYCSWFDVCWSFGVVGLEWYPCCRLKHSFSLQHGSHSNPTTPKLQHTSKQEHTTNVVIQYKSRKLLMMNILMSETYWAHKKWNKIASDSWSFILQRLGKFTGDVYTYTCLHLYIYIYAYIYIKHHELILQKTKWPLKLFMLTMFRT